VGLGFSTLRVAGPGLTSCCAHAFLDHRHLRVKGRASWSLDVHVDMATCSIDFGGNSPTPTSPGERQVTVDVDGDGSNPSRPTACKRVCSTSVPLVSRAGSRTW
jgi:hypothetical protein